MNQTRKMACFAHYHGQIPVSHSAKKWDALLPLAPHQIQIKIMKTKIILPILLLAGALLAGCTTSSALNNLHIGMDRSQVVALLGQPDSTSAQANVEYLTYYLAVNSQEGPLRDQPYLVRLVDGKVESFGRLGQLNDLYLRPVTNATPGSPNFPQTNLLAGLRRSLATAAFPPLPTSPPSWRSSRRSRTRVC